MELSESSFPFTFTVGVVFVGFVVVVCSWLGGREDVMSVVDVVAVINGGQSVRIVSPPLQLDCLSSTPSSPSSPSSSPSFSPNNTSSPSRPRVFLSLLLSIAILKGESRSSNRPRTFGLGLGGKDRGGERGRVGLLAPGGPIGKGLLGLLEAPEIVGPLGSVGSIGCCKNSP